MLLRSILDFLFPRECVVCHRRLAVTEDTLCVSCEVGLPRTMLWKVERDDNHFFERFMGKIDIENAFPYVYYEPKSSIAKVIYDFKYHHNRFAALAMGRKMGFELNLSGVFNDIDYLVPIPLTRKRMRMRGYNQSEQLCRGISAITAIPVLSNAILRTQFHKSQTKLSHHERKENIMRVFKINHEISAMLMGKHVMLIDDVITTGSTTIECAKALKEIPYLKLTIVSLAGRRSLKI